jgi:hypothetical protein
MPWRHRLNQPRTLAVLLAVLALCEVVVLTQYVGAIHRSTELSLQLEYARGAVMIAHAQALRCSSQSAAR